MPWSKRFRYLSFSILVAAFMVTGGSTSTSAMCSPNNPGYPYVDYYWCGSSYGDNPCTDGTADGMCYMGCIEVHSIPGTISFCNTSGGTPNYISYLLCQCG
jgi:hypothetical protein